MLRFCISGVIIVDKTRSFQLRVGTSFYGQHSLVSCHNHVSKQFLAAHDVVCFMLREVNGVERIEASS